MDPVKLEQRNIMVTGGSKGIGLAIAREFAARGANLFLVARGMEALEEARDSIVQEYPDIEVEVFACDVSDLDSVARCVAAMVEKCGQIHGVMNNAGFAYPQYFDQIAPEEFRRIIEVDYLGSVYITKAALPHLKSGSFIAFTSSVAGYVGTFGYTSYCPAKFAQIGFAEALDQELLSRDIQVSVLCPPNTETPGYRVENETKPFETDEMSNRASLMKAEDVARVFVRKLVRGKFLINVNLESAVIYRLKGTLPGVSRWIIRHMARAAQRKKARVE
jgi:3-dehydrosphinganine reductase